MHHYRKCEILIYMLVLSALDRADEYNMSPSKHCEDALLSDVEVASNVLWRVVTKVDLPWQHFLICYCTPGFVSLKFGRLH